MKPDDFNSLKKWFGDKMQDVYFSLPAGAVTTSCDGLKKAVNDLEKLMVGWYNNDIPDSKEVIKQCVVIGSFAMRIADNYKRILRVEYEEEINKNKEKK